MISARAMHVDDAQLIIGFHAMELPYVDSDRRPEYVRWIR